jgi:hypothetical protein
MIIRFMYFNLQLLLFNRESRILPKRQQVQSELTCSGMMLMPNTVKTLQFFFHGVGLTSPGTAATSGLLYSPR